MFKGKNTVSKQICKKKKYTPSELRTEFVVPGFLPIYFSLNCLSLSQKEKNTNAIM